MVMPNDGSVGGLQKLGNPYHKDTMTAKQNDIVPYRITTASINKFVKSILCFKHATDIRCTTSIATLSKSNQQMHSLIRAAGWQRNLSIVAFLSFFLLQQINFHELLLGNAPAVQFFDCSQIALF